MDQESQKNLYEKYPFAYFRQSCADIKGKKEWFSLPDNDNDWYNNVEYRLYPVLPRGSSEPSDSMIDGGAVLLGKKAVYAKEIELPDGVESFRGWKHPYARSRVGWDYAEKLTGKFSGDTLIFCIDPTDPNAEEIIDRNSIKRKEAKHCPFCGVKPDLFDPDFCYPVGRNLDLFQAGCIECAGGCSATVYGFTAYEAIDTWNHRFDEK